jgi:ABC-type transporter Mla subunit MlaD
MTIPPFGSSQDSGLDLARWSAPARLDDAAFDVIGQTVRHAAGALDGLKDILERLHSSVEQAAEQRRDDIEIGQLFVRAQQFLDGAVAQGHEIAQRMIADAEFEAARIVADAKDEAHRLIDEGRHSTSLPSEAVRALQTTIEEFGRMNSTLVEELSALADVLAIHGKPRPTVASARHSEGLSQTEAGDIPFAWTVQPRPSQAADQSDGSPAPTQPSAPTGYWNTTRPRRQLPSARVGQHSAPGTRWRIR